MSHDPFDPTPDPDGPSIPKAPRVPLFDREPFRDESVAKVFSRLLPTITAYLALFVALLALHSCLSGCAPQPEPAPLARVGFVQGSIVTTLKIQKAEPLDEQASDQWVDACNAFAIVRQQHTQLATSAHCIPRGTELGGQVRYLAPDGWGHHLAVLVELDTARDQAYLDPLDPEPLRPFRTGREPIVGEPVVSFSTVYSGDRSAGRVTAWLIGWPTGAWYETSQTIQYGWSGSPALDAQGRAWGVVCKCYAGESECKPGHALVSVLR